MCIWPMHYLVQKKTLGALSPILIGWILYNVQACWSWCAQSSLDGPNSLFSTKRRWCDYKTVVARAGGRRSLVVVRRCARVFLWAGVGRNPCRLVRPGRGAVIGGTIPSWRASWEASVYFTLSAGGNPRTNWSGQQRRVDGASLLEGAAWFSALRGTWSVVGQVGGCSGCGSSSLSRFIVAFISFLLGMFLLLPQHFRSFEPLYRRCVCYINIAGRKPVSLYNVQAMC
jgi:hypothetical protein